jgi:hypothetical protein
MREGLNESERLVLPDSLAEWVSTAQLADWILDDVATLNWTSPELMDLLRLHPDFEPKAILNTLTFGYALGVFSAEEIARLCSADPRFRAVRPKLPPLAPQLKRFRRENIALLKWTLVNVITRALKTQFAEGESISSFPPGIRRLILENATERLELARHLDRNVDVL